MKKLTILLLACLSLPARADERGEAILRRMAEAFNGYASYRVEFTATMEGEFVDLPGELLVSGEKYYLDVYDSQIFFDGQTGYTYSESNNEVILEIPDPADYRLFANPTRIFHLYEQDYTASFKNSVMIGSTSVEAVELEPRSTGAGSLTLYADPRGALPVRMVYRLEEYGTDLILNIVKITPNVPVTPRQFVFDPADHPGVEVIDFR